MIPRFFRSVHFAYPFVMLGLGLCHQMVAQWTMFYYAPPQAAGLPVYLGVAQVSLALALGRIMDAVADPLVAYYSDRLKSRWGRRKAFMIFGSPLLIFSFLFIWRPPIQEVSVLNLFWVSATLCLFFLTYSAVMVPYLALLPEIAPNDKTRVRLAGLQAAFYGAGAGSGFLLSTALGTALGIERLALFFAALVAVAVVWPAIILPERNEQQDHSERPPPGLLAALRSLKEDHAFLLWIASQAFVWAALIMFVTLLPYLGVVVLGVDSFLEISWPALLLLLLTAAGTAGISLKMLRSRGKDGSYRAALFLAGLLLALYALAGVPWVPGTSQQQVSLLTGLLSGPLVLLLILPNAVVAEIAEHHRIQHHERREALLYAGQGLIVKLAMAGGSALVGVFLHYSPGVFGDAGGLRLGYLASGSLLLASTLFFSRFLNLKREGTAS